MKINDIDYARAMDTITPTERRGMNCYRKLLTEGLRQANEMGLISIKASDPIDHTSEAGYVNLVICGRPSIFIWNSIGHGELKLSVWWDYDHDKNPAASREIFNHAGPLAKRARYPEIVGTITSGWLERNTGCYVQGFGGEGLLVTYLRRGAKEKIDIAQVPRPTAFACEGEFLL